MDKESTMGKEKTEEAEAEKEALKDFILNATDDTLAGFEDINNETMSIPFVRLLQKLSPQLDKQKAEFLVGGEEGQFFNTITKEIIGNEFSCIVLKFERVYIEWKPNRGGFCGYHSPENAEQIAASKVFGDWKTKDGNSLDETYVYLVLIAGKEKEGPMVLSFSSSAIKVAREWNRLMTTHIMENGQKAKPYYLIWHVKAEYQSNDKGTWYNPGIKFMGYIGAEQYAFAKEERKLLPARKVDYALLEGQSQSSEDVPF
jgi:hypothetical protein